MYRYSLHVNVTLYMTTGRKHCALFCTVVLHASLWIGGKSHLHVSFRHNNSRNDSNNYKFVSLTFIDQ